MRSKTVRRERLTSDELQSIAERLSAIVAAQIAAHEMDRTPGKETWVHSDPMTLGGKEPACLSVEDEARLFSNLNDKFLLREDGRKIGLLQVMLEGVWGRNSYTGLYTVSTVWGAPGEVWTSFA